MKSRSDSDFSGNGLMADQDFLKQNQLQPSAEVYYLNTAT